ncbi:universal stress protein [Nocardia mexicana]|uniref:Nucleotide-binding universal stress UspA family protein n=1 Tax=Nocardia mexicana TaxID=279262 RepID=A0A370HI97_9NOCA|nr:universal stress protein [Nocardia mexicana]RDI55189.1 nucleotide-binding universal stress UspA family protein [Nocardia mexicana]
MTSQRSDEQNLLASAAVVVGVDGSEGADHALRWAAHYAALRDRELRIVHATDLRGIRRVIGTYNVVVPPVVEAVEAHGKAVVGRAADAARSVSAGLRLTTMVSDDPPARLLIEQSSGAFATVVGATGSAGTLAHLGSTLLAVSAHGHGSIVVVRPDPESGNIVRDGGPVVVGVDGSRVSEAAIAAAFAEAAERRADLVAVHVWSDWDYGRFAGQDDPLLPGACLEEAERAILAERLAGWQEKYPDVQVWRKVYLSAPVPHLLTWSKSAQLLIVGSRGRGGLRGALLGSTSNSLVQHADCPVMVVHPAHR